MAANTNNEETMPHLIGRVLVNSGAAMSLLSMQVGIKTGIFAAMKTIGRPATCAEIAQASECHERWVHEWCIGQAAAGYISVDQTSALDNVNTTRYYLSQAQQFLFATPNNKVFNPEAAVKFMECMLPLRDGTIAAFKDGHGISYTEQPQAVADAIDTMKTPWTSNWLVPGIADQVPELYQKLQDGITLAEIGSGSGSAIVALAKAFPKSTFLAYDIVQDVVDKIRTRVADAKLDNVTAHNILSGDEADRLPTDHSVDAVINIDVIHDLPDPKQVMTDIFNALRPDGMWLSFEPNGQVEADGSCDMKDLLRNPMTSFRGGASLFVCMSSSLSGGTDSAGLGIFRLTSKVFAEMATSVGFQDVRAIPGRVVRAPKDTFYIVSVSKPGMSATDSESAGQSSL
jgi:ubiquinone/menaquinone biosynthesis C-methylase UbiE